MESFFGNCPKCGESTIPGSFICCGGTMSEQQVLPPLEPTKEETESAAGFWPSAEDNSLVRYYFSTTKCRERQLLTALASLAQSEAERERLRGELDRAKSLLRESFDEAQANDGNMWEESVIKFLRGAS